MSLGLGFSKDSIADLQGLLQNSQQNHDDEHVPPSRLTPTSSCTDFQEEDDFLFLEDEEEIEPTKELLSIPPPPTTLAAAAPPPTVVTTTKVPSIIPPPTVVKQTQRGIFPKGKAIPIITDLKAEKTETSNNDNKQKIVNTTIKNETASPSTTTNYYSAFTDATGYNDYVDPYAVTFANNKNNLIMFGSEREENDTEKKNLLCCLFPMLDKNESESDSDDDDNDISYSDSESDSVSDSDECESTLETEEVEDDDSGIIMTSNSNNRNGMSRNKKESTTVQTDLRKNQERQQTQQQQQQQSNKSNDTNNSNKTTATATTTQNQTEKKGSSPGVERLIKHSPSLDSLPKKGILKKTIMKQVPPPTQEGEGDLHVDGVERQFLLRKMVNDNGGGGSSSRRNLFPTYEPRSHDQTPNVNGDAVMDGGGGGGGNDDGINDDLQEKKTLNFDPMARVVSIKSRNNMTFMEKSQIWWQKSDYDDFKKTARIIAKAMIQGGSEIWLRTSNAWGKKQNSNDENKKEHTQAYHHALRKYGVHDDDDEEDSNDDDDSTEGDNKWWCKFGHSRRGLEHIVSINEGRQRHKYVSNAINIVLEEQRRQRVTLKDPKKLATLSLQYTSWARDLALASAAADAEAVQKKFNTNAATSRISYLDKKMKIIGENNTQLSASFIMSANPALTAQILDANTSSHYNLRQRENKPAAESKEESKNGKVISRLASGFGSRENGTMSMQIQIKL